MNPIPARHQNSRVQLPWNPVGFGVSLSLHLSDCCWHFHCYFCLLVLDGANGRGIFRLERQGVRDAFT